MNKPEIELKQVADYLKTIIDETGEGRAYRHNECNVTAWAMKAHNILSDVISDLHYDYVTKQPKT